MESSPGELDGNTEELTVGRKKSRFKLLKTRLFGRLKKKETEGQIKQSQSTGDVTSQGAKRCEEDSEDDCLHPRGTLLGSRALSHDSIFLADEVQSSGPARVLSQENVSSKIKALQLKLQQQNMRLGPPPLLIPTKRTEDSGATSEDDGLPYSPPEMSYQEGGMHRATKKYAEAKKPLSLLSLAGTGSEEDEQPPSRPLSPVSRLSPPPITSPTDLTSHSAGVDFSRPAFYVPSLDNSAAHHRMSVKPRNQRASTKGRRQMSGDDDVYRLRSSSMNNLDEPFPENDETSSTETISHHFSSSQARNPAEELILPAPISLPSCVPLQSQEEEVFALDDQPGGLPKEDNESLKPRELFQMEGRDDTNAPEPMPAVSQLDDAIVLQASSYTGENVGEETSDADNQHAEESVDAEEECQPNTSSAQISYAETDYVVTKKEEEEEGERDAMEECVDAEVSRQTEPLVSLPPLPVPRTKKPILEGRSISTRTMSDPKPEECEKETQLPETICSNTVPCGDKEESSKENDKHDKSRRPNSLRFSIASAKYRTVISEPTAKQDEESPSSALSPKASSSSQDLDFQLEKTDNTKPTEACRHTVSAPDKKNTLQKEVTVQNVTRTVVANPDKHEASSQTSERETCNEGDGAQDRRGLFGVKLRSTSLSLKYRSEVAKAKRRSLESQHTLNVYKGHVEKDQSFKDMKEVTNDMKTNVLTNPAPQNCELQQDLERDKELLPKPLPSPSREANTTSEPPWMSLVRDKSRTHQHSSSTKPSSQPGPPPNSTSFTPTQQTPRPTPQPRSNLSLTKKPQLKTELKPDNQSSQQTPSTVAPRAMLEKQASFNQSFEKSTASESANRAEPVDTKGAPKPGVRSNIQTEPEVFRRTTTLSTVKTEPAPTPTSSSSSPTTSSSSSSPFCRQQSVSDRAEPSWMELAKRKSLAWSDKSLD